MDVKEIIDRIKERWEKSERYELIIQFNKAPLGAATGGEGMGIEGGFLMRLKLTDIEAYKDVEDLIELYAEYCSKHGSILLRY